MGVKTPFARDSDGRMVLVQHVERGAACGCSCPECGAAVVAKKGPKVQWHFAHAGGAGCGEGPLHRAAVKRLAHMVRGVREHAPNGSGGPRYDVAVLSKSGRVRRVYEVCVTNPKDADWLAEHRTAGFPVTEVVLDADAFAKTALEAATWRQAVGRALRDAPRHVVSDGKGDVALCGRCGKRTLSVEHEHCARCEKALTCPECGGRKRPGYGTCGSCAPPSPWRTCESCGERSYNSDLYDSCYECGYDGGSSCYDDRRGWGDRW